MMPHSTPRLLFAVAHSVTVSGGVQLGSQVWKYGLHTGLAPAGQPPQSVRLVSGPQPSHAMPHW